MTIQLNMLTVHMYKSYFNGKYQVFSTDHKTPCVIHLTAFKRGWELELEQKTGKK